MTVERRIKNDKYVEAHKNIVDAAMQGQLPHKDYIDLLQLRCSSQAANKEAFENAITIVPTRKMFRTENRAKLADLARETTIYKIACEQSNKI